MREHREAASQWAQVVDRTTRCADGGERPDQAEVLGVLDDVLDDRDVVVNAAGSMPEDLNKLWRVKEHQQYHVEYGYSCMGYHQDQHRTGRQPRLRLHRWVVGEGGR